VNFVYQETRGLYIYRRKLEKLLKLITVKHLHNATSIFHAHNFAKSNSILYFISIYCLKIAVNKLSVLLNHLITCTSVVKMLLFPSGLEIKDSGQSRLFSTSLELCNKRYQVRGPENSNNTKYMTHFWGKEFRCFTLLVS
jgi:hypothetical protein